MALLVIGLFLFIVGYGIYAEVKQANEDREKFLEQRNKRR